jgi:hypothetical protein
LKKEEVATEKGEKDEMDTKRPRERGEDVI